MNPRSGSTADAAFAAARARLAAYRSLPARRRPPIDLTVPPAPTGLRVVTRPEIPTKPRGALWDAARDLRAGRSTARRLVAAAFDAADAQPGPPALCERLEQSAYTAADVLDHELARGGDRGALHGIPITVKDVIDVAGAETRCGSDAYFDRPTEDAIAIARLRAAGAIIIGKAVTHEFALGVTSPQLRNPHDDSRISGGSSGGSAVALVAGIGLASIGTDTRASIRTPAALSGAVGFKPTYGRIPTDGVVSLSWTMDHVAPMATSVADAAVVMDALLGTTDLATASATTVPGLRVGVPIDAYADAEPRVVASVGRAIELLAGLGATVSDVKHPDIEDLDDANSAGLIVSRCEAETLHRRLDLDRSLYWDEVRDQLAQAADIAAVDYLDAQRLRGELRDRFLEEFESVDVLVMPTSPIVAPPIDDFAAYLMLLSRNAIPWSCVGFPAISIPVGDAFGLPVGLQIVAPHYGEALLVAVASALETALAAGTA